MQPPHMRQERTGRCSCGIVTRGRGRCVPDPAMSQIRDTNHGLGMVVGSPLRSNELMTSAHLSTNQLASHAGTTEAGTIAVGIGPLSFDDVVAVARRDARVELTSDALEEIRRSRTIIEGLADDIEPHYGVSTGFGALATKHIAPEMRAQLQRSLVRSHAAGSGPEVEREVVRALMLLRLSTLATGRTGVREETAAAYAAVLNAGITPVVHE